jgi:putative ABC transport system permease protein
MANLRHDLRYAIRRMSQSRGFTAAAIATLALGLGINSAVLSLGEAIFFAPLPVQLPSRVVLVDQTDLGRPPIFAFPLSYPDYLYYRDHAHSFEALAAHYATSPMHVAMPDGGLELLGSVVTANYFGVLRLHPATGRFFTEDEDRVAGRNPVAVISYRLWRRHYEADDAALGAILRVNGTDFTIVGVAPEEFRGVLRGLEPVDVWIPTAMFKVGYRYCDGLSRECRILGLIGRLADGVSIDRAQDEMTLLARQLEAEFPATNKGRGVVVRPARGIRMDEQNQNRPIVAMMAVAGVLVLLVASANIAGLLLARGLRRRKEMATRLALGATRVRLVRQLLVESTLLALAGGIAGLMVAVWSIEVVRGFFGVTPRGELKYIDLSLDLRVVGAGLVIALATGILTGIAPAIQSTRTGPLPALKDESAGAGSRRTWLRDGLTVLQVAVSVVLLAASGLVVRSFLMVHQGPGFDPDRIVILRLRPSLIGYSAERAWAFQREVIRRLEAIPGVIAASPASTPPLPGWARGSASVRVAGQRTETEAAFNAATTYVGPRYFKMLGAALVDGREFDDGDRSDRPRVAIVNETLARHLWPHGGAAGNQLIVDHVRVEIVGVVKDFQFLRTSEAAVPTAYLNFWQQDTRDNWSHDSRTHVGTVGSAAAMLPAIKRAIAEIDPDVPIADAQALGDSLDYAFSDVRAARALFVVLGALTLVLSAIGLYATLAFAVGQRTREIAIRIALGAARIDVGRLVLQRGAAIVLIGVSAGVATSTVAGPVLSSLLYGVHPRDFLVLVAGPSLVAPIALLAMWLPARRAMLMDPMAVLRSE